MAWFQERGVPMTGLYSGPVSRQQRELYASLGVMAAQVMVAASRVLSEDGLEPIDKRVLSRTADLLRAQARAIRFVESGGTGHAPRKLAASSVATGLMFPERPADPETLAKEFDKVAADVARLASRKVTRATAQDLYERFAQMALTARSSAGSSGHRRPKVGLPAL
jgi:hypothetical protein